VVAEPRRRGTWAGLPITVASLAVAIWAMRWQNYFAASLALVPLLIGILLYLEVAVYARTCRSVGRRTGDRERTGARHPAPGLYSLRLCPGQTPGPNRLASTHSQAMI
jgi:hypothetical protein